MGMGWGFGHAKRGIHMENSSRPERVRAQANGRREKGGQGAAGRNRQDKIVIKTASSFSVAAHKILVKRNVRVAWRAERHQSGVRCP